MLTTTTEPEFSTLPPPAEPSSERRSAINEEQVQAFTDSLFGEDLHAKRVQSLALATLGVIHAASLSVHAIGQALAVARGKQGKHGVKQVDRLLSNSGIPVWELFALWVPYVLGQRSEAVVVLDWMRIPAKVSTRSSLLCQRSCRPESGSGTLLFLGHSRAHAEASIRRVTRSVALALATHGTYRMSALAGCYSRRDLVDATPQEVGGPRHRYNAGL
jgi:hypothetical protein